MAQYQLIHFTLNGRPVEKYIDVRASLTDMLRNDYRMTSVKKGCEVGECGACTVIMDGRAIYACLLYSMQAEGRDIRTIEGAGTLDKPSEFQQELIDGGAVQCGYCIPGMVMSATALMEAESTYPDDLVKEYMDGNLCRCTGYEKIWAALRRVLDRREAALAKKV